MVDVLLKNAIPYRKRSPSDLFLDNGLGLLNSYLKSEGFMVEVQDWANVNVFETLGDNKISEKIGRLHSEGKTGSDEYNDLQQLLDIKLRKSMEDKNTALAEYLQENSVPVFGEKTFFGDAWENSKSLFKKIKTISPETLVIAGGPQVTVWRELIFENSNADMFVIGEGEQTLEKIVKIRKEASSREEAIAEIIHQAEKGEINNLLYKNNDDEIIKTKISNMGINDKSIPSYDFFNYDNGFIPINDGKMNYHVLIDSMGCPWNKCTQCAHKNFYPKYRERDPELIINEIKYMLSKGVGIFRYAGSGARLTHFNNIAKKIIKNKLIINYSFFLRAISEANESYSKLVDSFKTLIGSGLRCVAMGGESGHEIINQIFNKGVSCDDVKYTHNALMDASVKIGIPVDFILHLMYPTTTKGLASHEQILEANLAFVKAIQPTTVAISPLATFYGSEVFQKKEEYGIKTGDDFALEMASYEFSPYLSKEYWRKFNYGIEDLKDDQIIMETVKLTLYIAELGIMTDMTDEQVIFARHCGFEGSKGLAKFKSMTLKDLISCSNSSLDRLYQKFNQKSREIALKNKECGL